MTLSEAQEAGKEFAAKKAIIEQDVDGIDSGNAAGSSDGFQPPSQPPKKRQKITRGTGASGQLKLKDVRNRLVSN